MDASLDDPRIARRLKALDAQGSIACTWKGWPGVVAFTTFRVVLVRGGRFTDPWQISYSGAAVDRVSATERVINSYGSGHAITFADADAAATFDAEFARRSAELAHRVQHSGDGADALGGTVATGAARGPAPAGGTRGLPSVREQCATSESWLLRLSDMLTALAWLTLGTGVIATIALWVHTVPVQDSFSGTVGRHDLIAAGFGMLWGSSVAAALLFWLGCAGRVQVLRGRIADSETGQPSRPTPVIDDTDPEQTFPIG